VRQGLGPALEGDVAGTARHRRERKPVTDVALEDLLGDQGREQVGSCARGGLTGVVSRQLDFTKRVGFTIEALIEPLPGVELVVPCAAVDVVIP
jgi:hypothetical protein